MKFLTRIGNLKHRQSAENNLQDLKLKLNLKLKTCRRHVVLVIGMPIFLQNPVLVQIIVTQRRAHVFFGTQCIL